ncbi:MAG: carbohydrate ABC transporter permease [Candidatus Odinarchaeota archaeon]
MEANIVETTEKRKEKTFFPVNSVVTIVCAVLFLLLGILVPIFNLVGGFLVSSIDNYYWSGVVVGPVSLSYEQLAGLFPVTWGYISSEYWWVYLLIGIWKYIFLIFGVLGTVLFVIPPVMNLLKAKPPHRLLASPKIGFLMALIAAVVEWVLLLFLWFFLAPPKPNPNVTLLLLFIVAVIILVTGYQIWVSKDNWFRNLRNWYSAGGFYGLVIVIVMYCIFPFVWATIQSFPDPAFRTGYVEYLPEHPSLVNYQLIFEVSPFEAFIRNSFIISMVTVILCVLIAAFGAYVLAKFQFKLSPMVLGLILSMTMFPGIVILIPLYMEYVFVNNTFGIQLVNNYIGVWLPYITFNLPLTLFLLYNFFKEIPDELVKAARVDGASNFQVFWKVIFPLAIPGIFTTAILVFIAAWNEFLFASLLLTTQQMQTIPVGMAYFTGIPRSGQAYDRFFTLNAATVIVTIPLIILVLIFQKQIVSGIVAGAVKG